MKKFMIFFVLMFVAATSLAFRVARPPTLSLPLNQDQINQLNDYNELIWNLTQGEYNFDIVTAVKTNADNGDMWFIKTGGTVRLHFKADNQVFTITPDGY